MGALFETREQRIGIAAILLVVLFFAVVGWQQDHSGPNAEQQCRDTYNSTPDNGQTEDQYVAQCVRDTNSFADNSH